MNTKITSDVGEVEPSELKNHFEMHLNAITRDVYESDCDDHCYPCVHFVNAIPISLTCLFSSVKNYTALSLSFSYTSRVIAFKGISKCFFSSLGGECLLSKI